MDKKYMKLYANEMGSLLPGKTNIFFATNTIFKIYVKLYA